MKKLLVGIFALALGLLGAPTAYAANVNNFTISSYDVDMTLGRDSDNRSTLAVKETIIAEFPSYDQNHGLERVFVQEYDGHSLSLAIASVTNEQGKNLNYSLDSGVMRIGDADSYVHGVQTYVIKYTMRDVTKYYSDTNRDELYWDAVGFDWQVPITKATIVLKIDGEIAAQASAPYCYVGVSGSAARCDMTLKSETATAQTSEKQALVYTGEVNAIGNGQGVTIASGFTAGTFAAYEPSFMERVVAIWGFVQVIVIPLSLVVMAWFIYAWYKRLNRRAELGTIVPEYLPPKETSVTAAARTAGYVRSVMTAQMLDLAVRHYIKIYEVKEKTLFSAAEYEIEIAQDISSLRQEEQELLKDTFGSLPSAGDRMNLKELQNNPSYYSRTLNNDSDLDTLIRGQYGLRELDEGTKKWSRRVSMFLLILALVTLSPFVVVPLLVVFAMSFMCWRLTDSGLALKRYLEGLKLYIGVAETERIKMLQSPEGAAKVATIAKGTDSAQLIKLYEKVLPYAVLFGLEKRWNEQLGRYYEAANASPDWYVGNNAVFNAAVFSSVMNGFSQANNYASSSSSSSGGSSGGGSAGGGGGGGGGGGW